MKTPDLTIFIGTYNRLETLERTVASYALLTMPHELVIVDNGTDHPECLRLLKAMKRSGAVKRVHHLPGCISMEEATWNFNIAIRAEHEETRTPWFAVSEADVCFDGTDPKALEVYMAIAEEEETAVGPHLRVSDIPVGYPLRSRVLACETWMLYREGMSHLEDNAYYAKCQTDTTFHLFPRVREFRRLQMDPIRVGPPYDAMHLDWYLDPAAPTRENAIYIRDERPMGSWGKAWLRDYWVWYQELGPEGALEMLSREPQHPSDLCNVAFIRSWAHQFGVGCEPDRALSEHWLREAIPWPNERYWALEADWMRAIYDGDLSALGWGDA